MGQPVKRQNPWNGENESRDRLAGGLLGNSSWPRSSAWNRTFQSRKWRGRWKSISRPTRLLQFHSGGEAKLPGVRVVANPPDSVSCLVNISHRSEDDPPPSTQPSQRC